MEYDVIIVGAGPSGLSSAIRLAQLCREHNKDYKICVLEKGAEVGAHILSGAVLEPRALNELIPNWQELNAPLKTAVSQDNFYYLTTSGHYTLPTPPPMHNHGNYIISLGQFCQWLSTQAENLGVEIFAGFNASQCLYGENNEVIGIQTGDMGVNKNNQPKSSFQPGVNIYAKYTLFAEGCRGHLSQQLIHKYQLQQHSQPQTYGIGIKELWEIPASQHQQGRVIHTVGWPLDPHTYGGSFVYHLADNLVSIGLVVGLDYKNPYLSPYQEFQRFKHHPLIASMLREGRCIKYGARALNEGGWQSIPTLHFPGGLLIGCAAGFLNVAKIKGTHTAMKSGMLAAESIFEALNNGTPKQITGYQEKIHNSWIKEDLYPVRNLRPSFKWGLWAGLAYSAIDYYLLRGKAPWTFAHNKDNDAIQLASQSKIIDYPKPDGKLSFDKMTSVSRANVYHDEDQPCHLHLKDPTIAINVNYKQYAGLEARYCPAGVYEFVKNPQSNDVSLQINAQNCIHCKTCDIKDPTQNICWVTPEGGGGPNYSNM